LRVVLVVELHSDAGSSRACDNSDHSARQAPLASAPRTPRGTPHRSQDHLDRRRRDRHARRGDHSHDALVATAGDDDSLLSAPDDDSLLAAPDEDAFLFAPDDDSLLAAPDHDHQRRDPPGTGRRR
jgi:hypothetical protein